MSFPHYSGIRLSDRDRLCLVAYRLVVAAINRGDIPPARKLRCVDCGKRAKAYDHRDYREPLKVEPVCRVCHQARGPGLPEITEVDGHYRKHELMIRHGKSAGHLWGGIEGGEGYSPLERRLVESPAVRRALEIEALCERGGAWHYIRDHRAPIVDDEKRWAERSLFFKSHDPWAHADLVEAGRAQR